MAYDTINDAVTMQGGKGTLLAERYRVVRQLGQGGMGSVWLAEDTQLDNKPFAVKMLPSVLVANKRAYRQLKDEALVAMRLVHPNIVQIRAFEENGGNPFLVMDYIDGETLDDYLAEKGNVNLTQSRREAESQRNLEDGCFGRGIPEEDVIRILKPIAAALDYAHARGVVHRDVKPGNVMIAKDGTPYILDFGIAREIQETMTRMTGKLSSGTLLYMSPEQLNGDVPRPAQDVYSFAAMVYECIEGEPPFSRGQIEHQILNNAPRPLRNAGALAVGIMAGLAKKPEDRPATCAGVLGGEAVARGDALARGRGRGFFPRLLLVSAAAVAASVAYLRFVDDEPPAKADNAGPSPAAGIPPVVAPPERPPPERPATAVQDVPNETNDAAEAAVSSKPPYHGCDDDEVVGIASAVTNDGVAASVPTPAPPPRPPAPDPEFVKATNLLAMAIAERKSEYDKAAAFRESPRGFANRLERIDMAYRRWQKDKAAYSPGELDKVRAMLDAVTNETGKLREEIKWMSDNKAKRDSAVGREKEFNGFYGAVKSRGAELFARAERRPDWKDVQAKIVAARKSIDDGLFDAATNSYSSLQSRIREMLVEEKGKAEAERLRAEEDARKGRIMEALRKDGFVLDKEANRRAPGTEKRMPLSDGEELVAVWCPPGWFMMGSPESEQDRIGGEARHPVRITKGFWIGKYEITKGQWGATMGESVWFGGRRPKTGISWNDCKAFIARLKSRFGVCARLPTEAEWEYACRAGTSTPFSFGNVLNGAQACCNGGEPYGTSARGPANISGPSDVGSFPGYANGWGINDMHGNVFEWCEDAFAEYPRADGVVEDPVNSADAGIRVYRGGCWNYAPKQCRSAFRTPGNQGLGNEMIGLRLAFDDLP